MIYNILAPFVICYYLYYEIVRLFPTGVATVGTLGIPMIGLFSGALILSEPLGWTEFTALGSRHRGARGAGGDAAGEFSARRMKTRCQAAGC